MDSNTATDIYKVLALLDRASDVVDAVRAAQRRKYKKDREAVSDIMYLSYKEVTLLWCMGGFSTLYARVNDEIMLWCADTEKRKKQATAKLALPADVVYVAATHASDLALLKKKGHRITFKVSKNFWDSMHKLHDEIKRLAYPKTQNTTEATAEKIPGGSALQYQPETEIRFKRSKSK
jgi:hypothetical protein